jgi:hypothetical protein
MSATPPTTIVGRYELTEQLAKGGIATVFLGRLHNVGGARLVAIKRLHTHLRADGDASTMFLDEARVGLRVRHPNVIHAVDLLVHEDEVLIVMEYVAGSSLSALLRRLTKRDEQIPPAIASRIVADVLHGLHGAHETCAEDGSSLGIVHRDVSPQNILVGTDGVARVLDFGVAKTLRQVHVTRHGEVKGKLTYMAPEQILAEPVTRAVDVFAAGIVLWEVLTGHRLFYGDNDIAVVRRILEEPIPPPSSLNPALPLELDRLVLSALERNPRARFPTAEAMAVELERIIPPSPARDVAAWVRMIDEDALDMRARLVAQIEGRPLFEPEPETVSVRSTTGARPALRRSPYRRAATLAGVLVTLASIAALGLRRSPGGPPAATNPVGETTTTTDEQTASSAPRSAFAPILGPREVTSSPTPTASEALADAGVSAARRPPSRVPHGGSRLRNPAPASPVGASTPTPATIPSNAGAPLYTRD